MVIPSLVLYVNIHNTFITYSAHWWNQASSLVHLETMLDRVAIYKEKSELLKQKIKKAMKYPATVVLVSADCYNHFNGQSCSSYFKAYSPLFGAELPAFTQNGCSHVHNGHNNYWFILIIVVAIIAGFLEAKKRSKKFRDFLDKARTQSSYFW